MNLLIEKNIWDEHFIWNFTEDLKNNDINYEIVEYLPFGDYGKDKELFESLMKYDDKWLFYGSLELAKVLQFANCTIYNTLDLYNCMNYYPYFYGFLLNGHHTFTTYEYLKKNRDVYFEHFRGYRDGIFIRPSRGDKVFTGMETFYNTFEQDIEFIERYNTISEDEIIVVAQARKIDFEARFVVHNGEVITGSLYKYHNDYTEEAIESDELLFGFAQDAINESSFSGDILWTIDISGTESGEINVLEIGSFSCAGLYACDTEKISKIIKGL